MQARLGSAATLTGAGKPLRILLVHNSYQQRGGEDVVFEAERDLLRASGCEVTTYEVSNEQVVGMSKLALLATTIWSRRHYRGIQACIRATEPHVAHFHNTLPLVSPAGYYAAKRCGVPVVQTLHNYRLLCPSGLLFRAGQICSECVGKFLPTPAIRHHCYRNSVGASAAVAGMLAVHRGRRTFERCVDRFVALTEFARQQYVHGGLPEQRIVVKPNFLANDPGVADGQRRGLLFVGRLSAEKGIDVLLAAAKQLVGDQQLTIVGDGPLRGVVQAAAAASTRIRYAGAVAPELVRNFLHGAQALLVPSQWFEGLPMTIVEAFACGVPVIASDLGSMASIVRHEHNGLLVAPADVTAWTEAMTLGCAAPPAWGRAARRDYERHYTAEANLTQLLAIYASVMQPSALPRCELAGVG